MSRDNDQPFLDDQEELLREQEDEDELEERNERIASINDLGDLDDLLTESVSLAKAKKQKAMGRRLDATDVEALERLRIAEEIAAWQPQCSILHVVHTVCQSCEAQEYQIRELFELYHHRKSNARKLTKVESTELPTYRYDTVEEVAHCTECLSIDNYEFADPAEHPILTSLGQPAEFLRQSEEDFPLDQELLALAATIAPEVHADGILIHDPESQPNTVETQTTELVVPPAIAQLAAEVPLDSAELEAACCAYAAGQNRAYPQLLADADSVGLVVCAGNADLVREVKNG